MQKVWDKYDSWVRVSIARHNIIVNHFQNFHIIGLNKHQKSGVDRGEGGSYMEDMKPKK